MFFLLLCIAVFPRASSAETTFTPEAKKEFIHSCETSFKRSRGGESEFSKKVCQCAADESQSQGVALKSLLAESKKIESDPKYEIQDEKLMNSLRYCSLELIRKQSYEQAGTPDAH